MNGFKPCGAARERPRDNFLTQLNETLAHSTGQTSDARLKVRSSLITVQPRAGINTMAHAREHYQSLDRILPPSIRNFLGEFKFGRLGLQVGSKTRLILREGGDLIRFKVWIRKFALPLRNVILFNRPLAISFGEIPVLLVPRGTLAGNVWTGLRRDRNEVSFLLSILAPNMIFFDIGANAGLFTISAAKKIGGNGVFAFEPSSEARELLGRNLTLNRVADVHVVQQVLWLPPGENVPRLEGSTTNGHSRDTMAVASVGDFIQEHNIARVDVMRIDAGGSELMALRRTMRLLERPDAPLILYGGFGSLTRGFGYHPVESLWLLESLGYNFFLLDSETGKVCELKMDYQYDSMVIAIKPMHPLYTKLRASLT
jgi:FkbM family methyltransferase